MLDSVLVRRVMKWVGRLQPEKGTAARRALETYRSENIRDSHTAVALPRRGAPRSLVVAPGLMENVIGRHDTLYVTTLFYVRSCQVTSSHGQVSIKSPSPSTLTSTAL